MKRFATKFLTLLILLFACFNVYGTEYHNETTKVTHFDYSQFNITFTDGDGIEKTVSILDEATTPEHMMALLREVYRNPEMPGIHYAYDYNGFQSRKIDYNKYGHLGDNSGGLWMGAKKDVYPNPYEDGMTLLLVQVREDWKISYHSKYSDMTEYFRAAFKSMKLITHFTRVHDEQNPGYLFSIDGATNRFFFISKGKPRSSYTKPLFRFFEQISPVNAQTGDLPTDSFIYEMREGNPYYCFHDCTNVLNMTGGHWFTISNTGEAYSLNNLSIFIPDRRFEYEMTPESDNYINSNFFNEYGNSQNPGEEDWSIMPSVLMYRVNLTTELDRTDTDENGGFKVKLDWHSSFENHLNVPEHFYVYTVDDDGNKTLLDVINNQPVQTNHYEYYVPREVDPYHIHYIVLGAPINYDNDGMMLMDNNEPLVTISAWSNIASIAVPGQDPYFSEIVEYRSRYDLSNEINIYKNKITISPVTPNDYAAIHNIHGNFDLIREWADSSCIVAVIHFDEIGTNEYSYRITYNDSTQDYIHLFDDEIPVTHSEMHDFRHSSISFIDRFTVSTMYNDQPDHYVYKCILEDSTVHSNTVYVPVQKTTNDVHMQGYTQQQVNNDLNHSLQAGNHAQITFTAENNPFDHIELYNVYFVQNNYSKIVGKAENMNNEGQYYVFGLNSANQLNDVQETRYIHDIDTLKLIDYNYNDYTTLRYVPVIKTVHDNTYGCDIKSITFPMVYADIVDMVRTNPFSGPTGLMMGYETKLKLHPVLTNDNNVVYYYRVWRIMNENTSHNNETILNNEQSITEATWNSDYEEIKVQYPGNGDVYVDDVFIDNMMNYEKTATYLVRMYSTDELGKEFCISEDIVYARFNDSIITGVVDIVNNNVIRTEYYNMTGLKNNIPYEGVNIVVKYMRNGTKTVEKHVF